MIHAMEVVCFLMLLCTIRWNVMKNVHKKCIMLSSMYLRLTRTNIGPVAFPNTVNTEGMHMPAMTHSKW